MKLAVHGGYSGYASEPLHDSICEPDNGREFFFAGTRDEAIDRVAEAQ